MLPLPFPIQHTKRPTSSEIVALIRQTTPDADFALSDSEAALLVDLFASVAVVKAERDILTAYLPIGASA